MKKTKFYLFVLLLILIPKTSFGLIEVDITRGNLNPLPIAVSPLFVESKSVKDFQNLLKIDNIGEDISTVVENKLARSNINIPFIVGDGSSLIRSKFLHFCYMNQIVGLRTKTPFNYQDFDMTEPLRISLYNGISIEDTIKLVSTMRDFEIL